MKVIGVKVVADACGWAALDGHRFVDLGIVACHALAALVAERGCELVVVEPDGRAIVEHVEAKVVTLPRGRWQRAVLPNAGRKLDEVLAHVAAKFILHKHPRVPPALELVEPSSRRHVIEAAMIALTGALRTGEVACAA